MAGVIFGRGGSNQSAAYQPVGRIESPDFTNQAYPPRHGLASPYGPFPAPPNVAADFSADFINGAASLPSQMTLTRASSGTYTDSSGIVQTATSNVARFDYDGYGSPKGLMIEEQRTNVLWPSDISDASFSLLNSTTKGTGATGPNGSASVRLIENAGAGDKGVTRGAGSPSSGSWSGFVYAKSIWPAIGSKRWLVLGVGGSTTFAASFDIVTGQVAALGNTSVKASIAYAGNGWWKCMIMGTVTDGASIAFGPSNTATPTAWQGRGTADYTGDGTSGLDVQLPQVENNATPSSFILTTTGAVTRSADIVSSTDATWLGYKGWVVETENLPDITATTLLGVNTVNGLGFTTGDVVTTAIGAAQSTTQTVSPYNINRSGVAWDSAPRVSIAVNGGGLTTAANTPVTPTTLYFGNLNNGASGFLNGHIRIFGGYATLADADLPSVTVQGATFSPAVSNIGSSTGSNTAVAIGAWLQSGVGASAGANTVTGVGSWLQSGAGSSAGANTATATGNWLQSGIGSSAGTNTATATGAWLQSGVGSATGSNSALAVGAELDSGVGSSAGTNTASATAAPIQSMPGSSTGTNTATAVGAWLQSGVGSSAGTNTATATGAWVQSGVGSAAGVNITTGIGSWLFSGVGASAGSNTATASGLWLQSGVGSSAGSNTTTATGHWLQSGVGNAQGDNTSSGYSPGVSNVGSSSGTNTAAAVGAWLQSGVGSSSGTNTATAVGLTGGVVTGAGSSVGANIATAIGAWIQSGVGTSIGGNIANGASPLAEADFNNDFAQDFSGYPGAEAGLGTGDFNNDFNNDFAVFHVGRIVSGTGYIGRWKHRYGCFLYRCLHSPGLSATASDTCQSMASGTRIS
jgi:hypothetical protein